MKLLLRPTLVRPVILFVNGELSMANKPFLSVVKLIHHSPLTIHDLTHHIFSLHLLTLQFFHHLFYQLARIPGPHNL